jgi:hypothetical protein
VDSGRTGSEEEGGGGGDERGGDEASRRGDGEGGVGGDVVRIGGTTAESTGGEISSEEDEG